MRGECNNLLKKETNKKLVNSNETYLEIARKIRLYQYSWEVEQRAKWLKSRK